MFQWDSTIKWLSYSVTSTILRNLEIILHVDAQIHSLGWNLELKIKEELYLINIFLLQVAPHNLSYIIFKQARSIGRQGQGRQIKNRRLFSRI